MKLASTAKSQWMVLFALLFLLALLPPAAEAHLNSTGLGPVYDGLAHFLLTPEDFIPVLALAFLAGQRGAGHGRRALFVLPTAWFLGGLVGLNTSTTAGSTALACLSFLILGGLLAADAKLSLRLLTALSAFVGFSHGFLNGAGLGTPQDPILVLLGLVLAVFVLVAIAAAFVVRLRYQWTRVAVRVVGSWVVASGLLLLGWSVRKG